MEENAMIQENVETDIVISNLIDVLAEMKHHRALLMISVILVLVALQCQNGHIYNLAKNLKKIHRNAKMILNVN